MKDWFLVFFFFVFFFFHWGFRNDFAEVNFLYFKAKQPLIVKLCRIDFFFIL